MRIASLVGTLACIVSFAIGSYFGLERGTVRNDIIATTFRETTTAFKETVREYLTLEKAMRESLPAYHLAQATPYLPQSQMTIAVFHGRYKRWEDLARQIRDQIGEPHPKQEHPRKERPAPASQQDVRNQWPQQRDLRDQLLLRVVEEKPQPHRTS